MWRVFDEFVDTTALHCWQPNIFGCWSSGVELPATGGYVGTVSGDLPHSTQYASGLALNQPIPTLQW